MIVFIPRYEIVNDVKSKIFSKNFKIEDSRNFQKCQFFHKKVDIYNFANNM